MTENGERPNRAGELVVHSIGPEEYGAYAGVTPEFTVTSVLVVEPVEKGLGGLLLRETPVADPYSKYEDDYGPVDWTMEWDLAEWGIFLATIGWSVVGGAAVAPATQGMWLVGADETFAVLWDIRVAPRFRRRGVGRTLLRRCAEWARDRGLSALAIETQNVNVPGTRFYAACGCELAEIRRHAYAHVPEFAHEAMLVWRLTL